MTSQRPPAPEEWGTCPPPPLPDSDDVAADAPANPAPPPRYGDALHLAQRAARKLIWLAIGLVGFRWASVVASSENAKLGEDKSLLESALRRELDSTHAELLSLRRECAALKGKLRGAIQ